MLTISQVNSASEIAAVGDLIREFTVWAISLQAGSENAPTFKNLEDELASLPGEYAPPSGALLLAIQDGQPAGCIALIGHDSKTCELKRLYVRPEFRGYRIGVALVRELLDRASEAGFERMVLDSHQSMKKAHELYRQFGFQEVEAPGDFPKVVKPYVVFMACELIDE